MQQKNSLIPAKKNLIIGANSFIGRHLIEHYKLHRSDLFFTDYKSQDPKACFDLRHPDFSLLPLDQGYAYGVIAAALPNIAFCERDTKTSYTCNVATPLALGKLFVENGITPIFFSSDYVFSQPNALNTESSQLHPITEYGRQKAELEKRIPEACGDQYVTFRLSKVYGCALGDNTLFDEMIQKLTLGKPIQAAYDQVFCPLSIEDVVSAIFLAQNLNLRGLFNLCGSETWSRYELALEVAKAFNFDPHLIEKVSLDDLNLGCARSKYTAMSNEKLSKALNFKPQSATEAIQTLRDDYCIAEKKPGC